jgi:hypothetical protein
LDTGDVSKQKKIRGPLKKLTTEGKKMPYFLAKILGWIGILPGTMINTWGFDQKIDEEHTKWKKEVF